jgi:hypothetical protein
VSGLDSGSFSPFFSKTKDPNTLEEIAKSEDTRRRIKLSSDDSPERQIDKLLQSIENRFSNMSNSAYIYDFGAHMWDQRIFWLASDGSHRFAAAYNIACENQLPRWLKGNLTIYGLDKDKVNALLNQYYALAINDESGDILREIHEDLEDISGERFSYLALELSNVAVLYKDWTIFLFEKRARYDLSSLAAILEKNGAIRFDERLKSYALNPDRILERYRKELRAIRPIATSD